MLVPSRDSGRCCLPRVSCSGTRSRAARANVAQTEALPRCSDGAGAWGTRARTGPQLVHLDLVASLRGIQGGQRADRAGADDHSLLR